MLVYSLKARDCLGDLGVVWRIILKWAIEKYGGKVWTGFAWIGKETDDRLLWRAMNVCVHRRRGIY
jgi:hypothetical protein